MQIRRRIIVSLVFGLIFLAAFQAASWLASAGHHDARVNSTAQSGAENSSVKINSAAVSSILFQTDCAYMKSPRNSLLE